MAVETTPSLPSNLVQFIDHFANGDFHLNELDGTEGNYNLRITAPKTPHVRPTDYADYFLPREQAKQLEAYLASLKNKSVQPTQMLEVFTGGVDSQDAQSILAKGSEASVLVPMPEPGQPLPTNADGSPARQVTIYSANEN